MLGAVLFDPTWSFEKVFKESEDESRVIGLEPVYWYVSLKIKGRICQLLPYPFLPILVQTPEVSIPKAVFPFMELNMSVYNFT